MDPETALHRLGGVARTADLLELTSRRRLRAALRSGAVLRLDRGRYALPGAAQARRDAARFAAVVCLQSAAAHHEWPQMRPPDRSHVAVRRGRRLSVEQRTDVVPHWLNLAEDQVRAGVTTPLRTVLDCARTLPFDEALAIADSALRAGDVARAELDDVVVRGAGASAVRRVLRRADGRAVNPFESALRARCIEAELHVEPQVAIDLGTGIIYPDLVDRTNLLVIEANSWTHHATRIAHGRDCARYNALVLHGWRVLRFTWEQVMHEPAYVGWILAGAVRRVGRPEVSPPARIPA